MADLVPFATPAAPAAETRGLAPARAALQRLVEWSRRERAALDKLVAGRATLAARIEAAEAALARASAEVEAEAQSVVDAIRRGVDYTLSFVRHREAPVPDLALARRALDKADLAIEVKRGELEGLAERAPGAVAACLAEEAQSIAADYAHALTAAAEAAARLAALDVHLGRGRTDRLTIVSPGFGLAGDEIDARVVAVTRAEIEAAAAVWSGLAEAIAKDPRADAARHLARFPRHGAVDDTATVYHELTAPERRLADIRRNVQN